MSSSLTSEGIPESRPKVPVIRAIGIATGNQVDSTHEVDLEHQAFGTPTHAKTDSRSGLHIIGPVLAFGIHSDVVVPVELGLGGTKSVPGSILRIADEIAIEPADIDAIAVGFVIPPARLPAEQAAEAFRERNATAIVGQSAILIRSRAKVAERGACLDPAHEAVPVTRRRADSKNERALREVLRSDPFQLSANV